MCLLCEKTFSNYDVKPAKMRSHLERIHFGERNIDIGYFKMLMQKFRVQPHMNAFF